MSNEPIKIEVDSSVSCSNDGTKSITVHVHFPARFKRFFQHVDALSDTFKAWIALYNQAIEGTIVGDMHDKLNVYETHGLFDHLSRAACQAIMVDLDEDGCYGGKDMSPQQVRLDLGEKGARLAKWLVANGIPFPVQDVIKKVFADIWEGSLDEWLSEILVGMEGATDPEEDPTRYKSSLRDAGF